MRSMGLEEVKAFAREVFKNQGLRQDQTSILIEVVVTGQRGECQPHGLCRLSNCTTVLAAGKVVASANPEVYDQPLGIAHVDAKGGGSRLDFNSSLYSLATEVPKQGVASIGVNHCIPSHAWVAPSGETPPLLGPNPLALDSSRPSGQNPIIYNFATGSVAGGDIKLHLREENTFLRDGELETGASIVEVPLTY